jgi:hypothetical protein
MAGIKARLDQALRECDRHALRIREASARLAGVFPLTAAGWTHLTSASVEHIDQLVYRFAKLQDTLGRKVFPRLLTWLGEDVQDLPFLDLLDRLERLGIVSSADAWQELRETRNVLAHDYEEDPALGAAALNLLHQRTAQLLAMHHHVVQWMTHRQGTA